MNKNVYYPTYTIDPQSIYGSGIVRPNKFPTTNTTTSVITDSFPVNKKLSPPIYRSGLSLKPQDTNGYRILTNPDRQSYKLDDFYYASQQTNKNIIPIIKPTLKEKLAEKIKNVAENIVNDKNINSDDHKNKKNNKNNKNNKKNNKNKNNKLNKSDKKQFYDGKYKRFNKNKNNYSLENDNRNDNDNEDLEQIDSSSELNFDPETNIDSQSVMNYIDDNLKLDNANAPVDKFGRNKKMWINDHYLYALEPRYNSVVYPWRAYTWMYPVTPNSDNYYIDNINSSPADPIIVSNDTTNKGNWQSTYLNTNMLRENFDSTNDPKNNSTLKQLENKYQQNKCVLNYNVLYFIIIVLILSIYFYKE